MIHQITMHKIGQAILGKLVFASWRFCGNRQKTIIFPKNETEYFVQALAILPAYMHEYDVKNVLVISSDQRVLRVAAHIRCNIRIHKESERNIERFLAYFAMVDVSKDVIVISVTKPYETGAERLLGRQDVEISDIVFWDIYKLSDKEKLRKQMLSDREVEKIRAVFGERHEY